MTAATDRFAWVSGFTNAWAKAAGGQADHEHLIEVGEALYPVLKDRSPEQIAREHYDNTPKPEPLRVRRPEKEFGELAARLGIVKEGDKLDQNLLSFAHGVAEKCAAIGDQYGYGRDSAGLHIRSVYGAQQAWPGTEEDVPF